MERKQYIEALADPEIFMSGGKSNDWGILCINLQKYGEISFKYEEISQDFEILSGGHGSTQLHLGPLHRSCSMDNLLIPSLTISPNQFIYHGKIYDTPLIF
jgi:hypothetical protein